MIGAPVAEAVFLAGRMLALSDPDVALQHVAALDQDIQDNTPVNSTKWASNAIFYDGLLSLCSHTDPDVLIAVMRVLSTLTKRHPYNKTVFTAPAVFDRLKEIMMFAGQAYWGQASLNVAAVAADVITELYTPEVFFSNSHEFCNWSVPFLGLFTSDAAVSVAAMITALAKSGIMAQAFVSAGAVDHLTSLMKHGKGSAQLTAMQALHALARANYAHACFMHEAGLVDHLKDMLYKSFSATLQAAACWLLSGLATAIPEFVQDPDMCKLMIKIMGFLDATADKELVLQATAVVYEFAQTGLAAQTFFVNAGVLEKLIGILPRGGTVMARSLQFTVSALVFFSSNNPILKQRVVETGDCVAVLVNLLNCRDTFVQTLISEAIRFLSANVEDVQHAFGDAMVALVDLCRMGTPALQYSTLLTCAVLMGAPKNRDEFVKIHGTSMLLSIMNGKVKTTPGAKTVAQYIFRELEEASLVHA
jgi:hypothetical protein